MSDDDERKPVLTGPALMRALLSAPDARAFDAIARAADNSSVNDRDMLKRAKRARAACDKSLRNAWRRDVQDLTGKHWGQYDQASAPKRPKSKGRRPHPVLANAAPDFLPSYRKAVGNAAIYMATVKAKYRERTGKSRMPREDFKKALNALIPELEKQFCKIGNKEFFEDNIVRYLKTGRF